MSNILITGNKILLFSHKLSCVKADLLLRSLLPNRDDINIIFGLVVLCLYVLCG